MLNISKQSWQGKKIKIKDNEDGENHRKKTKNFEQTLIFILGNIFGTFECIYLLLLGNFYRKFLLSFVFRNTKYANHVDVFFIFVFKYLIQFDSV